MLEFQSQTSVRSNSGVVWIPRTPPPWIRHCVVRINGCQCKGFPQEQRKVSVIKRSPYKAGVRKAAGFDCTMFTTRRKDNWLIKLRKDVAYFTPRSREGTWGELKQQRWRQLQIRHLKVYSRCFKLYRAYFISFSSSKDCIVVQEKKKKVAVLCFRPPHTKNEYSRPLNASYTFQPLMSFCHSPSQFHKIFTHDWRTLDKQCRLCYIN